MIKQNQRGDTIVEVLVALSIIGAVIAGVFTAANRSQTVNQQSQERSAAVRLAESQLELIKAVSNEVGEVTNNMFNVDTARGFCLTGVEDIEFHEYNVGNLEEDPLVADSDGGPYADVCVVNERYYVYNQRIEEANGKQRFRTTVQWIRLGGGRDRVAMTYGLQETEITNLSTGPIVAIATHPILQNVTYKVDRYIGHPLVIHEEKTSELIAINNFSHQYSLDNYNNVSL